MSYAIVGAVIDFTGNSFAALIYIHIKYTLNSGSCHIYLIFVEVHSNTAKYNTFAVKFETDYACISLQHLNADCNHKMTSDSLTCH